MTRYHVVSLKKKGKVNAINIFNFQRLVRGGLRNTENQRDSHSVRVQSSYKFCRSDGRSRCQIGHSSPGRVANHHLHRLYHFRGLPGSSNFDLSIISRTEGNYYTIPNFAPISNFQPRISLSFLSVGQNDHPQESLRVPVDRGNFIRLRNRANEPENCLRYRRWIIAFLFPLRIRLDVPRRYLYYIPFRKYYPSAVYRTINERFINGRKFDSTLKFLFQGSNYT